MSDKIQTNLYLLNDSHKTKKGSKVVDQKIDFLFISRFLKEHHFKEQDVKPNISPKYEVKVYFKKTVNQIKWKEFIGTIVLSGEEIIKNSNSISESYVIVIYSKISDKYFVSTGGYAHTVIQEIAMNDYGLQILSRILKAEDKSLRSTKERSLTGGIQGSIKFFRNEYNLYENESFGNIYNELNASLNKDLLVSTFGFAKHELKSDSLCIAKNSFSIKKSISFLELLKLIERCETLMKRKPVVEINSVEKISKSNVVLISELNEELLKSVYKNYTTPSSVFSVEIANKDFEKYYYANSSVFSFSLSRKKNHKKYTDSPKTIQVLLDDIRNESNSLTYNDFKSLIENSYLETYDVNEETLTRDTLINHFCSEITHSGFSYFFIEKDWYKIGATFIDKINDSVEHFVVTHSYTGPQMKEWNVGRENEYNSQYFSIADSLVFDWFTPQNIEACDIMRWTSSKVYFYHVKKGFDNSMRDLCSQVFIAAKKIQEDSKNNYQYIGDLYDRVVNNNGQSDYSKNAKKHLEKKSKQELVDIVKNKTIVFVLAVLDTSNNSRKLKTDIRKFDSNIAKFSINELSKNMRNLEVKFEILQLEK